MVKSHSIKWTSVNSSEIINSKYRLDASAYNIEARKASVTLQNCGFPIVNLWSADGPVASAFYPTRFRRIYVNRDHGLPMILPSQMLSIMPKPTKFISKKSLNNLELLKLKRNTLLLTRSGTIGNCALVTAALEGKTMSDDVIRIFFKSEFDLGFTYAYLRSRIGQLMLATNNYGAVIQHIEPEHLENVPIPNPPVELKQEVHSKISKSFALRDRSNELIERAEAILLDKLGLGDITEIAPKNFRKAGVQNFVVSSERLDDRFEATYHVPVVDRIAELLQQNGIAVLPLGDSSLTRRITLPGRFKRNYVNEGEGVIFLGGKQIHELDPSNKKYLSIKTHSDRISKQLFLEENMIVITCSGTIGRVNIVPPHWVNWTMSQHVLRVVPAGEDIAGYLYIWLNSDFGRVLIERFKYGAVVDEINDDHISQVQVPVIKDTKAVKEINDLALEAKNLRSEAYHLERSAIEQLETEILSDGV